MSIGYCEILGCRFPSMAGIICNTHWDELGEALDGVPRAQRLLDGGPAKGTTEVRGGQAAGMLVRQPVMDAREALCGALADAQRVICPGVPRLVPVDAVRLLRAHSKRLRGSYAAPLLLEALEPALKKVENAVDKPRGRMSVPGRCRECGPSMLHLVGGLLECDRCAERMTIGSVRNAS